MSVAGEPDITLVSAGWVMIAGCCSITTCASPDAVPSHDESENCMMASDPDSGIVRFTDVVLMPFCTRPSDHVTLNGGTPVKTAVALALSPEQISPPPVTIAVGRAIVGSAEPLRLSPLRCTVMKMN